MFAYSITNLQIKMNNNEIKNHFLYVFKQNFQNPTHTNYTTEYLTVDKQKKYKY